ncbi:MAG: preprotein translocase subunit SecG [Clostridia bacterium]|nr:preprotein translocase subunit SecG [Clostridia bacterium]MBR6479363.1 preprotein translocase subunit SecG [Clostridia bacterium]MBR6513155.1 preprotein translocase subunit SecG [Clostridia bacterium]
MTGLQIALSVILIVVSILLIVIVLLQKNRQADASAINGSTSNSFFDKTQSRGKDATLEKLTIILGVVLLVVVIVTIAVTLFV